MAQRRPRPVARVLERVTATLREHDMVLPGQVVLACVSGGPDSVCLVESLVRLRRLFRIRVEVFHFDHRLRPDSGKDAVYVKGLADRLRLPFHPVEAATAPARGESVEAWARGQRIVAASAVANEVGAARIAEGHTVDDQAETVLIALVRGGGLSALAGISPVLGRRIQPLLEVTRVEVESFCRSLGLRPRLDPSNLDTRLLRNAIRLRALPALERATGREVRGTIARSAELLRLDERELARLSRVAFDEVVDDMPDGVLLRRDALLVLPRAIAARVVRAAVYHLGVLPTEEGVTGVLALAGRPRTGERISAAGLRAERAGAYVRLSRPSPEGSDRERGAR